MTVSTIPKNAQRTIAYLWINVVYFFLNTFCCVQSSVLIHMHWFPFSFCKHPPPTEWYWYSHEVVFNVWFVYPLSYGRCVLMSSREVCSLLLLFVFSEKDGRPTHTTWRNIDLCYALFANVMLFSDQPSHACTACITYNNIMICN